ncbi:hypothetical protein [Pedobacter sp. MC2016-24]|uniref:hypothetical protein n=1 Tax=Pedobacter sp. MC2016-24 TaxID=2780090 RepID=UPI001881B268|nr:hypothetical protein [Pedobacter sp. MC2016-24]MBE9603154.1 hypothetical protein [Pedobacter sp. MC2016-24]
MKKVSIAIMLVFSLGQAFAQDQNPNLSSGAVVDSLKKRISNLEESLSVSIKESVVGEKNKTIAKYKEGLLSIRSGLEKGAEIEMIVPYTSNLLALKDLSETLALINNPTAKSVGTAFTDMVVQSATENLLPKYTNPVENTTAKSKFSSVLNAIFNGPIIQSLINSNPISSTINAAIQQAGFFQKRETTASLSKQQLNSINSHTSASIAVNLGNPDGPAFGDVEINKFNASLQDRVNFYSELNDYGVKQSLETQRLYTELGTIKKTLKASKTELCKVLSISPNDVSIALDAKYNPDGLDIDRMKGYLNSQEFNRAIVLSNYAKDQLPDVKDFNNAVIDALIEYINGYITILNKHAGIANAKLDKALVAHQVAKLEKIKSNLKKL